MDTKEKSVTFAKVIGGVVCGAIAFVVSFTLVGGGVSSCIGNSVERQIEKQASDMNKTLPKQIDELTRLDRVEAGPGKAYSYIYTLSRGLSDAEKKSVREAVTKRALGAPEMRKIFAAGVTVWYKYYDASGKSVLEFSVQKT